MEVREMPRRSETALRVIDEHKDRVEQENLDEIRQFAESLPDNYLECREANHNWKKFRAGRYRDGGFQRVFRCARCKTKKIMELSSRGMIISSRYIHPDDYLHKGMGQIVGEGRGVLRLASIMRDKNLAMIDEDDD